MAEHASVFITLTAKQIVAILDELIAKGCDLSNAETLLREVLTRHGTGIDDLNRYIEANEDEDVTGEDSLCRNLLGCLIGATLDARENVLKTPDNISYAISHHSSGHYFDESIFLSTVYQKKMRAVMDNPYHNAWTTYRETYLYPQGPHKRLRGNHTLGVFEYCAETDYDYMVQFATGTPWWNFNGFDWMVEFYGKFRKTRKTDAAVERLCRILPLIYIDPKSVAALHSDRAKAESIWQKTLATRPATMPVQGQFSKNVFFDFAKKKRLICLFLGLVGCHKFYAQQYEAGSAYLLSLAGLGIMYIADLVNFRKKFKAYGNKRDYFDPDQAFEYIGA